MLLYEKNDKKGLVFSFDNKVLSEEELTKSFQMGLNENGTPAIAIGEKEVSDDEPMMPFYIGEVGYDTLVAAVAAVQTGETIKMTRDFTGGGIGVFQDHAATNFVIDFQNNTYTANAPAEGSAGTKTQGFHFEKTADGNRQITLKNGVIKSVALAESNIKMLLQNYCELTLDNMVIDGSGLNDSAVRYTVSNNFGKLVINNSVISALDGKVAFDIWFGNASVYDEGLEVIMNSGSIIGDVEYGCATAAPGRVANWTEFTKLTINDGSIVGNLKNSCAASVGFDIANANITINGGTQVGDNWNLFQ